MTDDKLSDYRKRDIAKVIALGIGWTAGCSVLSNTLVYGAWSLWKQEWLPHLPTVLYVSTFVITVGLVVGTDRWAVPWITRFAPPVKAAVDTTGESE